LRFYGKVLLITEESGGFMENNTFKSVTFGGFDKQSVIEYIEKTAQEASAAAQQLQQELDTIQQERDEQRDELSRLHSEVESLSAERDRLSSALEREKSARQALEPLKPDLDRLSAEVERLRPDAESYAQFREKIGAIECEARKRAADLESSANARLGGLLASFRTQYQELMSTFDTTAGYVTGELRKIEVNLSQLPRALDQLGSELNTLEGTLKDTKPQP